MSDSGQLVDYTASKAAWRARLLADRQAMPEASRVEAAARVQATLAQLLAGLAAELTPPITITGYVPFGAEPGGRRLPELLAAGLPAGGRLLLPVLLADLALDWARYDGVLVPGHRGLVQPPGARLGQAAISQAALVVVPALAVDERGVRLGRGGGSYDRALARVSMGTEVVALLYDEELVPKLPAQPHDQRVTSVITPGRGLVRLPTG